MAAIAEVPTHLEGKMLANLTGIIDLALSQSESATSRPVELEGEKDEAVDDESKLTLKR